MKTPLIFLAFANDADAHLSLLKEESRGLFGALAELDRKEYIKVHREESAQDQDLFAVSTRYKDRMAIFHYGGHAGGTHLQLESGAGDARGLATLLGEQENLKLVFLNGCSTKGQVETLMNAGVKAVVATAVPIQDARAKEFAQQFYEALANRRSIGQAFKLAEAFLKTRYGDQKDVQFRDFNFDAATIEEPQGEETLAWGLYVKDEHRDEIINWKLPYFRPVGLPKDMIQYIGKSFTANRYIVLVLDEMCKYNPDIYAKMVEKRGEETIKKDSRHYPGLIIENFPWPIGSQIRLLRFYDQPNKERLEHLISTYIVTSQVLCFILLSDLWEKSRHSEEEEKMEVPGRSKDEFTNYDFFGILPSLYRFLNKFGLPYVGEFDLLVEQIEQADGSLAKAHQYLEQLRGKLGEDGAIPEMEKTCQRTEQALSIVLRHVAFLARYRMLTIRNIMIDKPRFEELSYELDMGPLNATQGIDLNLYQDDRSRRKKTFADSSSIILVSNEDRLDKALSLSPFIMDKNTFAQVKKSETTEKDKLAHVFMLGWDEGDRTYYFAVEHSFFVALEKESDQIHTDMTQEDFTEGRNLEEEPVDEFGFDFGFDDDDAGADGGDDSPKVFQMLKDQLEMFKAELT